MLQNIHVEIFDSGNKGSLASPAARKEHHLGEFGEATDGSVSAHSGADRMPSAILVALRGVTSWTAWGPYESVTPVATMPKGSHGELRETGRKRDKRKNKRKSGVKRERNGGKKRKKAAEDVEKWERRGNGERAKYPRGD